MPTEKPRVFVTFEPDLMDLVHDYMLDHGFSSQSAAVNHIVYQFLHEYFTIKQHGVTLFQK